MKKGNVFFNRLKYIHFYLFSLLPMFVLYFLSDITFFILYVVIKYRKEVVRKNLRNSFPEKTDKELLKIEKAFYHHFCDIIFEMWKLLIVPKSWGIRHLRIINPELLHKYYDEERSVILYMAHMGNWEMFTFLPLLIPYKQLAFYQPLSNKYYDQITKSIRERFGVIGIKSSSGYRELMKYKQNGVLTSTMILGDQSPGYDSSIHWIQFLNQETGFLMGAERIAKKSNQVLLYPAFRKTKRGFYEVEFMLISDNAKDLDGETIVKKYASLLEESIKVSPEMWLWSHNRWKRKKK
jgi:Kdo2-lipid IVA lauroyltransferase/acyltransferase